MKYLAAAMSTIAFLALLSAPATSVAEQAAGKQYVLAVEGMSCPVGCVPKVHDALQSIDGVQSVEVDFDSGRAVVKMAPGKTLTEEACNKSFGNQGYFISSIEEKQLADAGN
jgi:copper chaperone CopZ